MGPSKQKLSKRIQKQIREGGVIDDNYLSHVMRKPVLAICEQQRCRSACASVQSDQHLCCSLL